MYVEGGCLSGRFSFKGDDFGSTDFRRSVWHHTTTAVALLTCAAGDKVDVMACEWAMLVSISPFLLRGRGPCFARHRCALGGCLSACPEPSRRGRYLSIAESGEFGLGVRSDQHAVLSCYAILSLSKDRPPTRCQPAPTRCATSTSRPPVLSLRAITTALPCRQTRPRPRPGDPVLS
jgi:hypothetical protein